MLRIETTRSKVTGMCDTLKGSTLSFGATQCSFVEIQRRFEMTYCLMRPEDGDRQWVHPKCS